MSEPTLDEYRTGYIATRWDLPDNAARALQLFELGYSVSGATQHLPVTESTVSKYHERIMSEIHKDAVLPIGGAGRDGSLDVWGDRPISKVGDLSYEDGVSDAEQVNSNVTTQRGQIDPKFRERELPLNEGGSLADLPDEVLQRIDINVD